MTKEKLELAVEKNKEIIETERAIQALNDSVFFGIDCFSDKYYKLASIEIPQEIVDFAIDWFIKAKEKLEKEFEEL